MRWTAPDGVQIRTTLSVCDDDMGRLATTLLTNLDAVEARGQRAMVMIAQGTNLPASWLAECETYNLDTPRFKGDLCVPWDPNYQARLRTALVDVIGPAINGHPALVGVYFTTPTMTNGAEFHFRISRSEFAEPNEDFHSAYRGIMDIYQQAFDAPILFEAGHCMWTDDVDCEAPLDLYRYTRDTHGKSNIGIALWNCAERFWAGSGNAETFGVRPLLEEASADGVSIGCQTVGNFTEGACRFTSTEVGDYGSSTGEVGSECVLDDPDFSPERACVETLNWFTGSLSAEELASRGDSLAIKGTWGELWSTDVGANGIHSTSAACQTAAELLSPR